MILNQGQNAALDALGQFLVGPDKYFTLEGPGGVGKTTVIGKFEDDLDAINETLALLGLPPKGALHFCASTNKAASLFGGARTIHKLLHLSVQSDSRTGRRYLHQSMPVWLTNAVIVIDEASMLGPDILNYLEMSTADDCKIIFLLDHCQLAPVDSDEPLVHTKGYPSAVLTEPMRQGADSFLYQQCTAFRKGVEDMVAIKPQAGPGIRIVSDTVFKAEAVQALASGEHTRVLAYGNEWVEALNQYLRHKIHGDTIIRVGDVLTMATAKEGSTFVVEGSYQVMVVRPGKPWGLMNTVQVLLKSRKGVLETHTLPVDKSEYFKILKELRNQGSKEGDWKPYFTFLNTISDFRDVYACTVHKSQGSTYDKVFIDMQNLRECRDLNTFVRLCYVAISRARTEVIFYTGE